MELIKTWEFRINKNTDDSSQKYPDLPFSMTLQAGENTYSANVTFIDNRDEALHFTYLPDAERYRDILSRDYDMNFVIMKDKKQIKD